MFQTTEQFNTGKENPGTKMRQDTTCRLVGEGFPLSLQNSRTHNLSLRDLYFEEPVPVELIPAV